jgi:predicted DNA-binding transcriptional regulator AlpA
MEQSVGIVQKALSRLGLNYDAVPQLTHLRLSLDRLRLGHRDSVLTPLTSSGRGNDSRAKEYARAVIVLASFLYKAAGAGQGEADKAAAKAALKYGLVEHISPKTVCRWRLAHTKGNSGAFHSQELLNRRSDDQTCFDIGWRLFNPLSQREMTIRNLRQLGPTRSSVSGGPMKIDETLDTPSASKHCGISESTLEKWRVAGSGPPFLKLGRLVRYSRSDLDNWMSSRRVHSTSEAVPSK